MDDWSGTGRGGTRAHLVEDYLDRIAARDVIGARRLVLSELAEDEGLSALIDELLVPAMAEVGDRWYDGRWNPALEHIACGITETALSAASVRTRSSRPTTDAPTAVLVCPRGEEHVLPARFVGELLVEAGADVIVLGLPVPDAALADFLVESRPSALIVSCTEPLALSGVRAAVAVAHRVGVPALVGGAGLGPDGRRAASVGADGWAEEPDGALQLLRAWRDEVPVLAATGPEHPEVVELRKLPTGSISDGLAADEARTVVELVVRALACSLIGEDERLLRDTVTWVRGLLHRRGTPSAVVDSALEMTGAALRQRGLVRAHELLTSA